MGTLIAVEFLSLDGVMEEPRWSGPWFDDEVARFQFDNLMESDSLLLGRVTYEGFKEAWPATSDPQGFADRMNALPKHVVSATLTEPEWNATFVSGRVVDAVRQLKADTDERIMLEGSATLFNALYAHGLIDELRLMIFPITLGSGKRLFDETGQTKTMELVKSQLSPSGVAILTYRPA
ncbi:dihydrofolate reductase family protein [Diaminobutyricibacter tongyongensis]|uniref:Dihydrofolate reductase family protein n=1 Tax=Leifsonia tongyongensis TaxID=1268043 RepID=A0A6L9XX07_9MICO|nr:dihydrofolate reductase family protein [Diaminobutyricibacter tongyongensis]NEN05949.1 dihydrofolate reductase family protein [Diaminobutyricibacter tongyongensis]